MRSIEPTRTGCLSVLVYLAMLACLQTAEAQDSRGAGSPPTPAIEHDVGQTVIRFLRDGQLEKAFTTLNAIADRVPDADLIDEGRLSSACGCLHRALSQLNSEAQFDVLSKWSMPADGPPRIRILTALVPTISPPQEFARALGERPRSTSFPIASVGEVRGVFSTGWSLVVAARESGKLKRLIADLSQLADRGVPNADALLAFAQIADGRGDMSKLALKLSSRLDHLQSNNAGGIANPTAFDSINLILAAAGLQHPALKPISEKMMAEWVGGRDKEPAGNLRSFLRSAYATAILLDTKSPQDSNVSSRLSPQWKYWVAVSGIPFGSKSPAMADGTWLTHEDHILHWSGSGRDLLLMRYPLTGDFEFQFETQIDGRLETNGEPTYGGLCFQTLNPSRELHVTDMSGDLVAKRICPFIPHPPTASFHLVSIVSTPTSAMMSFKRHPIWTDTDGFASSPWLGLASLGESRPLFRNFKIIGHPVIPRSVSICEGNRLRGWSSQVFGTAADRVAGINSDWNLTEGVLHGPNRAPKANPNPAEEMLCYQRPLLSGETISYEFFYQPGECEVSPGLGRVAFLLQPEGVRIHWVTDGDQDWTGLDANNTVTEPLNRRGPRPLPFKPDDWNRLTLVRSETAVTISLNDVVVYQRPVDWAGSHQFGLYRHCDGHAVQVRNVVLAGDWPETLPQEFLDNPTATLGEPPSQADRLALNRLFQEEFLVENGLAVRRKALALPVAKRFEFLSQWVLPGPDHPGFRVTGDFTQTNPSPAKMEPGSTHPEAGGEIVSPIFDWLDAAKELGRLPDCRRSVENAVVPREEFQQRAQAALLILLGLELGDTEMTASAYGKLVTLFKTQNVVGIADQWPETLVMDYGARRFATNEIVSELVSYLHGQRTQQWRPADNQLWHGHVMSLFGRIQQAKPLEADTVRVSRSGSKDWIPLTAAKMVTRGDGYHNVEWYRGTNKVVKRSGHDEDFLFYRLPLSGNYEVECDLMDHTQLVVAGRYVGLLWDHKHLDLGRFGPGDPNLPIDPPFSPIDFWTRYRVVMRDGICTRFINGREVRIEAPPKNADPWIGIRSWGRSQSGMRDFRITGQPIVLDSVLMSAATDLTGWISYHDEPMNISNQGWTYQQDFESGGEIVGHRNAALSGMFAESLLRYERPLIEDGSIEYDFFFESGQSETHPALDRLAFILNPSGVREHWIGDGRHDRTDLEPDNMTDHVNGRRGPAELPLKNGQWNRLRLDLRGTTVGIEINGTQVYERELESGNQRTFGLFHFVDDTKVRVRNVIMRGDWPKTVPLPANQELAGEAADALDADLPRLKSVFSCDFSKEAVPDKYFQLPELTSGAAITPTTSGVLVTRPGVGDWTGTSIASRFTMSGDFDVEAGFLELRLDSDKFSEAMLSVTLNDERKTMYRCVRSLTSGTLREFLSSLTVLQPDGNRSWHGSSKPTDAISGRFRLARRGRKLYYLFAEGTSVNFRVMSTETVSEVGTVLEGVLLQSNCNGVGNSSVVWKNLVLRAEGMKWHPAPSAPRPQVLGVMKSDGTELRVIASPLSVGFTHIGSPEWSADGRKIAVDMSKNSTATSHVIVMNSDGSEIKDLGPGCMPSFSKDGSEIVFSQPGKGIIKMKSDGTDRKVIDASGWGTQWSPDGKWIAYGKSGNITLFDVETRKSRQLLTGDAANRYGTIYWNLGWSHDSRTIAFKALRRDGKTDELAIVNVNATDGFKVILNNATSITPDCTFSPDNEHVVVVVYDGGVQAPHLYKISQKQIGPPQRLFDQPSTFEINGCAWSHDGKSIVVTGTEVPQPVEWVTEPVTAAPIR